MKNKRSWWATGFLAVGVVLILVAVLVEALSGSAGAGVVVPGSFGAVFVELVVIRLLLRRGKGTSGGGLRLIVSGVVGGLISSVLYALPPHLVVLAALTLMAGVALFAFGMATVGGGLFGIIGAIAGGISLAAIMMAPTPIALATMNHTMTCQIPRAPFGDSRLHFVAHCPNGKTYSIKSRQEHATGVPVRMLADSHGLLKPEIADRVHVHKDELALVLSLLTGIGAVVAALVDRRRRHGRVSPVVPPQNVSMS